MTGVPVKDGVNFFNHFESQSWVTRNGQPITNWKTKLASWVAENRQTTRINENKPPTRYKGPNL
jgi:hypothetical protein